MFTYETIQTALESVKKPCAFLHMESLEKNIETILAMSGDKQIRIASKSIRSVQVLKMIMKKSERFQGLMCFTAEEAIYLYDQGFDDLLIAYPTWDETYLRKVCHYVKKGASITVMIDSKEHINHLKRIAEKEKAHFLVAIDVDLSTQFPGLYFGVYRSPLKSIASVVDLVREVHRTSNLKLDGLMGYEAQIAGVADATPNQAVKNRLLRTLKSISLKEISQKRKQLMKALQKEGVSLRFINGGGTGSLLTTQKEEHITEVTAGSGFYNSHLFDKYESFRLKPAIYFATEITRKPAHNIFTCAGGGYVASGAMGNDKLPEVFLPIGGKLVKNEGVGEVQTPIKYDGPIPLTYGDPIIFRHSKAGEICERFNHLYLIKNNHVVDKIRTYRGDGKCFL